MLVVVVQLVLLVKLLLQGLGELRKHWASLHLTEVLLGLAEVVETHAAPWIVDPRQVHLVSLLLHLLLRWCLRYLVLLLYNEVIHKLFVLQQHIVQ